ncbi:MAG TPA: hypothetical protein VG963_31625, partial [Polyangiaceae bacterium]|nr:hypothetical protein [Polyangiaceae bacterium]
MSRRARGRPWSWCAGGAVCLAFACAQFLNTDGVQVLEPEETAIAPAGAAGAGGSGGAPACQASDLRCVGAALQVCRDDLSGFRTARVCSTPQLCCSDPSLCANPGCQPPACAPGDFRCSGASLEICNDGQTDWTPIATCPSAAQCNASQGRCTDQPCNAATPDLECSGGDLLQCGSAGWSQVRACETQGLCNTASAAANCKPNGCQIGSALPSPFRCDNVDLLRCNDEQTGFEFVETCLNAVHCDGLIDVTGPDSTLGLNDLRRLGCSAPACAPGHFACDGSRLMLCNQDRTGYRILVQDCGTPGKCNASTGQCDAVECAVGAQHCSGNQRQVCTSAHTWTTVENCAGAAQCTPEACRPATCAASDYRCDGASLERCNIDGDGWIPVHDCQSEELCNAAAKRCDPPLCETGEQRCSHAGELQTCSAGRDGWVTRSDCRQLAGLAPTASPEQISGVCDLGGAGQCRSAPGCTSGALRCNAEFLERCQNGGWQPLQRCTSAALCDATGSGSCHDAACSPGS